MSTVKVRLDLSYTVTLTREPGESWPRLLVAHNALAEVTQVSVKVRYEDGELTAETPDITQGKRLRKDGTPGARLGSYHGYYSFWERDARKDVVNAQSGAFRDRALAIAQQEFARLLGASLSVEGAGSYER